MKEAHLFRVTFLHLSKHLLIQIIYILCMDLAFFNILYYIFDSFKTCLYAFEYLICKHLSLRILRVLLKLLFIFLKLFLHHFYLCLQLAHFFNLLGLCILNCILFWCYLLIDLCNWFFQIMDSLRLILHLSLMILFHLIHFNFWKLFQFFLFLIDFPNLSHFFIKLQL